MTLATTLFLLLIVASIVAMFARRLKLPYTVALVVADERVARTLLDEITERYLQLETARTVTAPPANGEEEE